MVKTCLKCATEKPLDQFNKNASRKDGLSAWCKSCNQEWSRKRNALNPDYLREWKKKNPDAWGNWYSNNKERRREYNVAWYHGRRDAEAMRYSAWRKENPEKVNAIISRRRAAKLNATPAWANKERIAMFYQVALKLTDETGIRHEVDHIVPLRSKIVCGLHWEGNLQVLTKTENARKSNRTWPDRS